MARSYPIQKIGDVNDDMYDKRKRKRIFHINMVRKWSRPRLIIVSLNTAKRCYDVDSIPPKIGENLTTVQKRKFYAVLDEFSEVLDDESGQTDITIHGIDTVNSLPIRQAPYRIPYALKRKQLKRS